MYMVILNGYNRNKVIGGRDLTFFMLRHDLFYFWHAEFEKGLVMGDSELWGDVLGMI